MRTAKYEALKDYLARQRGEQVVLSFTALQAILDAPLPSSAHRRSWWSNSWLASAQARAWLLAGWRVASVDTDRGVVAFVRR